MAEETKAHFTFSFFDAAHMDGYTAPPNGSTKEFKRNDNQLTFHQHGKGFFSDEEKDEEDIVTKIHHWKQTSTKESKTKAPRKRQDLFAEPVKKESAQPESDDTIPFESNDIQLNRLLDDYMLGEKGDQIVQQMETNHERPAITCTEAEVSLPTLGWRDDK